MGAFVLGVDPANEGGAALRDPSGRRAVTAWSWERHEPAKGISVWELWRDDQQPRDMPSLHSIGAEIARTCEALGAPWHLCAERLFARPGLALHGVVSLAEATGELLGPLREGAATVTRVLASQWRPMVLGCDAYEASGVAERILWRRLAEYRPPLLLGLEGWLEVEQRVEKGKAVTHPRWPHVLEAGAIAKFGWLQQQGPAQMALVGGRR